MPAGEAVDLNGEELDLVPVGDLVDAVGEEGNEAGDARRGRRAGRRVGFGGEGVFGDEEGALEVIGAIDEDDEAAVVDVAEDVGGVGCVAGEAEPEDVDGDSGLVDREVGGGAGGGVAAVAAD